MKGKNNEFLTIKDSLLVVDGPKERQGTQFLNDREDVLDDLIQRRGVIRARRIYEGFGSNN